MSQLFLRSPIKLISEALINVIEKTVGIRDPATPIIPFGKSNDWDYQSAFANKLFSQAKKTNPDLAKRFPTASEMAREVGVNLKATYPQLVQEVEITEQGFLLILIGTPFLQEEAKVLLKEPVQIEPAHDKETVVVDFSSPNIAKEMHVGHLRSTILGESICRILEFKGYDVRRVNHVGDWGTQFGMLIAYLIKNFPDYMDNIPNLKDLETFYKESKKAFDEDETFKKEAHQFVVRLQAGDPDVLKAWKVLCDISRQFFVKIYQRLDIKNNEYGESFYNPMIPDVLKELEEKGLVKLDKGAKCIFVPKKQIPLMVVKSDGGYNYDTTDMAAARFRLRDWNAKRVIYLTDVGQFPHFDLIFEASKMAGWHIEGKNSMEHMGFGLVLGTDMKKIKTRSGETVKLMDLLDEGRERAKQQLMFRLQGGEGDQESEQGHKTQLSPEEIEGAAEILAIAAVKYFDMRLNRIQNYAFDYDAMLNQKGNTAVYLMYSYIRLCSIIRKSGLTEAELIAHPFTFTHDYELVLLRQCVKFSETLSIVMTELSINRLCDYLYSLACRIAEGYNVYKVLNNEHSKNRVAMIYVCKKIMEKCFFLLAIKTIDKI
jgi:arginyl-tRNA synthetase